MDKLGPGDLVRIAESECEMLVIGCADEEPDGNNGMSSYFCVWEYQHRLFEEVFPEPVLMLIRKERRRIPRGGEMAFPSRDGAPKHGRSAES
jgi:hypothetical protein